MNIDTLQYITISDLFYEFSAMELMEQFFGCDLSFTFGDANRTLIVLEDILDELETQIDTQECYDFITKVSEHKDYKPRLYVDVEN